MKLYLFEETLRLAKNVFELSEIKEVALQRLGVRVYLLHFVLQFLKGRLNIEQRTVQNCSRLLDNCLKTKMLA